MPETLTIYQRLGQVQIELKAPKNQFNSFAKYNYRSAEDIIEAAKPLCVEHDLVLVISDDIRQIGERYYITATASVYNPEGQHITVTAHAREADDKKGADSAQITGATSSYARKYALNGLFAIDDTKDADTDEHRNQRAPAQPAPRQPPTPITPKPSPNVPPPFAVNNAYSGPPIDLSEEAKQDMLDLIAAAKNDTDWKRIIADANAAKNNPGVREALWLVIVTAAPDAATLMRLKGAAAATNAVTQRVFTAANYRSQDVA